MKKFLSLINILIIIFIFTGCNASSHKSTGSLKVSFFADNTESNTNIEEASSLLATVPDILSSKEVFIKLSGKLDNKYTIDELKGKITIKRSKNNSTVTCITAVGKTQEEADEIKNMFLEIAPQIITYYIPHIYVKILS